MQQLVPPPFDAIAYIGRAVYFCIALSLYLADAVAQRSVFPHVEAAGASHGGPFHPPQVA
jgi:hypothetical protein